MARTKSIVDAGRPRSGAQAAASGDGMNDMDVDLPSSVLVCSTSQSEELSSASDSDDGDDGLTDPAAFADDLADDADHEQAQALLEERSKRQTLFASMFADIGAASLSVAPSTTAPSAPKPRGKRMRRTSHDDKDFDPAEHAPLRRSTRSRTASNYDGDDFDSDFGGRGGGRSKKRKTSRPNGNVHDLDRSELMRTFKTTSDVSHLKLPYARVPDPYPSAANRSFGHIPGVPVGSLFYFRQDVHHAGIHRGFVAGIFGHEQFGCWSICVNGGYPEDIDEGDRIVFTGSGGRELKEKNLRTANQSCDQSVNNKCNASLIKSHATGHPIRVVRGPKSHSPYTPEGAYRYDGIYKCTNWEFATGKTGFRVLRFTLERLMDQTPLADLPTSFDDARWIGIRDEVLAFRGMTAEQLEAQAQAADSQVGQMKETKEGGAVVASTAGDRPKRAAKTEKVKVESEVESESGSDVEVADAIVESVPPTTVKGKGEGKAKAQAVGTPSSALASASISAQPTRRSARQTTTPAASSSATAQHRPTRSSARLNATSTPFQAYLSSSLSSDDSDLSDSNDVGQSRAPPPPHRPGGRFVLEIVLPPPPRNAHLILRKRLQLANSVLLDPPSPLFSQDDWAGMSRKQQSAVLAQWKPPSERVFVHPFELQGMTEEECRGLQLADRMGAGGEHALAEGTPRSESEAPTNGEAAAGEEELTPRASLLAPPEMEVPFVDSRLPSSDASPSRVGNGDKKNGIEDRMQVDNQGHDDAAELKAFVPDSGVGEEGVSMA